ncbi:sugar ABC transporter ATP-binding protein [Micromonospora sediminimaris]|uniref:Ribose/galactose/methyl galactoside import ATP-binding protein 3 n=1 Tax=Micromonospora sediminimaris TaxID=547162 RepID=A0A9W5UVP9_9ACTN|nr:MULTISPECIES: sugar ABC transporter ATP-binding protein [Micromonospora]WFE44067.1 sugar ABC transporter ATP-binding protein [Verrucosispora sp. WMMD1129]GIJ35589.1 putative ribose/galactose/methyl galactoside import ATP-binding protein 3 [Micromonospora sediminimaris]SFC54822.1 ribose transport system ATP-binding protein [Micromonospora sediminimaris]
MSARPPALLTLRGIGKSFFGVRVLDGVDLDVAPGEVHAVVGENGAGKSTLMKIVSGGYAPDGGTVEFAGRARVFGGPRDAQRAGIGIIHQEFNLLPERTVAENVYLGHEPKRRGLVDRRQMLSRTAELLATIGETELPADAVVGRLGVAQQQVVEIAKALALDARLLIMDEPTAALADHEVELLYGLVRRLQQQGIGLLYVSHRLTEVFDLSDRITVLKDGRLVRTMRTADATPEDLVRQMVGRELSSYYPDRAAPGDVGAVRLAVRGGGNRKLRDVDLELRAGEVLGIGGLQGSGRSALARALFGVEPFTTGVVTIDGRPTRLRSPRAATRAGLAYVTEDRKGEGIVARQSVLDNALLASRAVFPARSGRAARTVRVRELLAAVEVRAAGDDQEIRFLSGGNQQKVVLARWLALDPLILLFDEPTRGIDVGAKSAIHDLVRRLARAGAAVLMISSELPELLGMSDRMLVMRDGRVAGELPAGATEEDVVALAVGTVREAAA